MHTYRYTGLCIVYIVLIGWCVLVEKLVMGSIQNPGFGSTLKQLDLLKIFGLFFRTLWYPGFSAKQALNSKQSAKRYERIIASFILTPIKPILCPILGK